MNGIIFRYNNIDKVILYNKNAYIKIALLSDVNLELIDELYSFNKYEFETLEINITPDVCRLNSISDEEVYIELVKRVYLKMIK